MKKVLIFCAMIVSIVGSGFHALHAMENAFISFSITLPEQSPFGADARSQLYSQYREKIPSIQIHNVSSYSSVKDLKTHFITDLLSGVYSVGKDNLPSEAIEQFKQHVQIIFFLKNEKLCDDDSLMASGLNNNSKLQVQFEGKDVIQRNVPDDGEKITLRIMFPQESPNPDRVTFNTIYTQRFLPAIPDGLEVTVSTNQTVVDLKGEIKQIIKDILIDKCGALLAAIQFFFQCFDDFQLKMNNEKLANDSSLKNCGLSDNDVLYASFYDGIRVCIPEALKFVDYLYNDLLDIVYGQFCKKTPHLDIDNPDIQTVGDLYGAVIAKLFEKFTDFALSKTYLGFLEDGILRNGVLSSAKAFHNFMDMLELKIFYKDLALHNRVAVARDTLVSDLESTNLCLRKEITYRRVDLTKRGRFYDDLPDDVRKNKKPVRRVLFSDDQDEEVYTLTIHLPQALSLVDAHQGIEAHYKEIDKNDFVLTFNSSQTVHDVLDHVVQGVATRMSTNDKELGFNEMSKLLKRVCEWNLVLSPDSNQPVKKWFPVKSLQDTMFFLQGNEKNTDKTEGNGNIITLFVRLAEKSPKPQEMTFTQIYNQLYSFFENVMIPVEISTNKTVEELGQRVREIFEGAFEHEKIEKETIKQFLADIPTMWFQESTTSRFPRLLEDTKMLLKGYNVIDGQVLDVSFSTVAGGRGSLLEKKSNDALLPLYQDLSKNNPPPQRLIRDNKDHSNNNDQFTIFLPQNINFSDELIKVVYKDFRNITPSISVDREEGMTIASLYEKTIKALAEQFYEYCCNSPVIGTNYRINGNIPLSAHNLQLLLMDQGLQLSYVYAFEEKFPELQKSVDELKDCKLALGASVGYRTFDLSTGTEVKDKKNILGEITNHLAIVADKTRELIDRVEDGPFCTFTIHFPAELDFGNDGLPEWYKNGASGKSVKIECDQNKNVYVLLDEAVKKLSEHLHDGMSKVDQVNFTQNDIYDLIKADYSWCLFPTGSDTSLQVYDIPVAALNATEFRLGLATGEKGNFVHNDWDETVLRG